MQFIQILDAEAGVTQGEFSPLNVEISTIPNTIGGNSSTISLVDSNFTSVSASSYWNDYVVVAGTLENPATTENLTPEIATLSGNLVSRLTDGICKLKSTSGPVMKGTYLNMSLQSGVVADTFTSYVNGSISDITADNLISMLSTGADSNYFSTVDNDSATYIKNLGSWAASIDLAPISVATDCLGVWAKRNNGTLITRRHIIGAKHWNVYYPSYAAAAGWIPGNQIRFVDSTNTVHTRTVLGVSYVSDIAVATLDSDIPVSITPMKIMGDWFIRNRTAINANIDRYYIGGLAFHINANYNCNFVVVGSLGNSQANRLSATINGTLFGFDQVQFCQAKNRITSISPVPGFLSGHMDYYDTGHGGDSGNPLMMVLSGAPVLLWTWWYETGGPPVWTTGMLNALIAEADAEASVSTGYTVTVATNPL